jgi:hypothetical protein
MDAKQLLKKIAQKNQLSKRLVQKGAPLIGIFWVDPIKKKIELTFAEPADSIELEPGSEFITGPLGHYAIWEQYKRNGLLPEKWKDQEYEYVPRGRVLHDIKKKRFKVFSSQELAQSSWFREAIIKEFNLPSGKTSFFGDEHYEDPLVRK